jgi:hypothetical protein
MDFGQIVTAAWHIAWRQRGLWVLALFAGNASGTCNSPISSSGMPNTGAEGSDAFSQTLTQTQIDQLQAAVQQYSGQAIAIGLGIALVLLLIYIPFWLLSVRCKGAIIVAGAEAAAGAPVSLGIAWRRGGPAFGRLFGLDLVLLAAWLVVIAVIVGFAAASILGQPLQRIQWLPWVFGLLGVFSLVGIVASVLGLIIAYAQRAIVLEDAGPIEGLRAGYQLLRRNLGNSVILWLIALALSIGGGIALVIGVLVAAIPALLVGGIVSFMLNLAGLEGIPALIIIVGLGLFAAILVGGAALNSFLWHFWTVAYLRLTGAWPPAPEVPAASAAEPV